LSYSEDHRRPEEVSVRRGGVGLPTGFGKKTTSACGTAVGGVVPLRDLSGITTPDFFAAATEWGLADFFKFALLRVETTAATEMDSVEIC